ncbi:quinone oxidoreductase, putative [Bodo saltans]|uniref:Quinone oxidoreductase, putative n=1 Tax=Bodo saltans TaxID=75058 RepID=A0A0S4IUY2_BODSA|nr:quinone oxidoreductase, putative [Bodo saltans]|eukprot:CUG14035.1 quinone oxidoreductase, putative [Bodo saltans]
MVREYGGTGNIAVEDFGAKDLTVGPNDVLVRNSFAGVNFIDTYFRTGLYKKPALPYVVGEEGSGAIVKVGENVSKERLGQRVAYFAGSSGSYSSFSTVAHQDAYPVPDGVGDDVAASAMLQGCTAHYLTESVYQIRPGDVVLVHAAAGGTGLLLTQMAKRRGAVVVGTCGGAAKADIAKKFGSVDHLIDYQQNGGDWVSRVRELFPEGVHCVYDGVGKSTFLQSLKSLRRRGTLATFGNASGPIGPISPLILSQHGSIILQRPTLKDFALHVNNEAEGRVHDVLTAIQRGELKVTIGKVFPLQQSQDAHQYLEARQSHGKILINCQE